MTRTVIIGGGVIGLSVAYHLSKRDAGEIILLERNTLTSGTSWHAAGIVGPLRATPNMTRLASHALTLFPALEEETGLSTGYRQTGGYWLARVPERLDELHRIADLGTTQGLTPRVIPPAEVAAPGLDLSTHVGALHVPEDGNVNPVDLCMAYAKAARAGGVDIREGVTVARIDTQGPRATGVTLRDGSQITADRVILCTGAWSRELAATAGVPLPLQAVEHMYVVTEPMADLPAPFPVIRDLDTGIYIKGDTGKLVIGGFEPHAKCWDAYGPEGDRAFLEMAEDWDQFAPFMKAALSLLPTLENTGIQHFMNGPESFTSDTRPLVGETPQVDGLFVAAGMNSVGVMSSAGIGRLLADWVVDGAPPHDAWEVDVARADPAAAAPAHMAERMEEAVSDLFALHWPYKQPKAGRNLRRSSMHDSWAAKGAVFGVTAGWERPLWFAHNEAERDVPYAVGPQPWQAIAAREAAQMEHGVVLLDLAPMTKLCLKGDEVYEALNHLSCAELSYNETVRYAPFLNASGGIEIDATVQCYAPKGARITSPAATRQRDLAWVRRQLADFNVTLHDQTEDFVILGLMGAASREMLQGLTGDDLGDFHFGQLRHLTVDDMHIHAQRLSFVGEMGYELWLPTSPNDTPARIFDALISAGAEPMGHYALEGCRIEKGFKHWGHDIGPTVTPLEAGLAFTIDWNKDFIGKDALLRQRAKGVTRRLVLMQIEGDALMLHDEPIFEDGEFVGLTTSGAMGPRTGVNLAFGMVTVPPGETPAQTCTRRLTVRVAGRDYPAKPLRNPPFDPEGRRMRP